MALGDATGRVNNKKENLQETRKEHNKESQEERTVQVEALRKKIIKRMSRPRDPTKSSLKKEKYHLNQEVLKSKKRNKMDTSNMQVTPKLAFRTLPDALNPSTEPLDHDLWRNTRYSESDPQSIPQLSTFIYRYLKRVERLYEPSPNFLSLQEGIGKKERSIQIDWLLRLCHEMRLRRDTFYLATSMMDRYLELRKIKKEEFDHLALSCLFCAAKYEEVIFPTVKDFVFLSGDVLTEDEIFRREIEILETIGWRMHHCHPMTFFDELSKGMHLEPKVYHFSQFVIETLIYTGDNARFNNSVMGSATLYLALRFFGLDNIKFDPIQGLYTLEELKETAKGLWKVVR